jgi:hypothetical protein
MDGGVLINGAWQQYLGRVPYRDFSTGLPPLHLILSGAAFKAFGPSWTSLTILTALFSAVTFMLCYILASWRGASPLEAAAIALVPQAVTFMTASWWCYNEEVSIVASLFVLSCGILLKEPESPPPFLGMTAFAISAGLLLLCKPNITGPLLLGATLTLFLGFPRMRVSLIVSLAVAGVLALAFLLAAHVSPFDLLREYHGASSRLSHPRGMLYNLLWYGEWEAAPTDCLFVLLVLWTAWLFRRHRDFIEASPRTKAIARLVTVCSAVSFFGMLTNNDLNMTELPIMLISLWMFQQELGPQSDRPAILYRRLLLPLTALYLVIFATCIAVSRADIVGKGDGQFARNSFDRMGLHQTNRKLFNGMWINGIFDNVDGDLARFVRMYSGPGGLDGRVYFGPRVDYAYAEFGITPLEDLPLWWEGIGNTDQRTTRFLDHRFEYIILWRNDGDVGDISFLPKAIMADLAANYEQVPFPHIYVLRRKRLAAPNPN